MLLCAILFVVKFPWLQRTFKTTELDDHPRIPKEKSLNSLKAAAYFCGVFLKQVWTPHGAAYQRYSFCNCNLKSFAAEQKSVEWRGKRVDSNAKEYYMTFKKKNIVFEEQLIRLEIKRESQIPNCT